MKTQQKIIDKLTTQLRPVHLEVLNESYMHSVPPGSESHFKVVIVTEAFAGQRQVKRHQLVYGVLSEELADDVHALALHTYAPSEWNQTMSAPQSPQCMGGSKQD